MLFCLKSILTINHSNLKEGEISMYLLSTPKGWFSFASRRLYSGAGNYYALFNQSESEVILCRELEPSENEDDFTYVCFLVDRQERSTSPCASLLLHSKISLKQADSIVSSLQRGRKQLQSMQNHKT